MTTFLFTFLFTISGDMTALEYASIASRMARGNHISKGACVRFDFENYPAVKLCRGDRGHPYFCRVYTFSSWMENELTVCEDFNEI